MTHIRTLVAGAALALLSTAAGAADLAPSDAAARTAVAIHYIRLATDALHPCGAYTGLSGAEVAALLDIDALCGRVGLTLTLTDHGWAPVDGWGNAIPIAPVVDKREKARRYTVTFPGVDGGDCKEVVSVLTHGVRIEVDGRPIRSDRVPGVVCRHTDAEGQVDVVLTLP